jgi:hypothetical protein
MPPMSLSGTAVDVGTLGSAVVVVVAIVAKVMSDMDVDMEMDIGMVMEFMATSLLERA